MRTHTERHKGVHGRRGVRMHVRTHYRNRGGGMHLRGLQPMGDPCQSRYTLKGTAASASPTPEQKQVRREELEEEKE